MTEAVVAQRNTVLAGGFANPLVLAANAEDEDHVKVYGDDELLTLGVDYTLDGVGDTGNLDAIDGVEATIDSDIIIADLYTTFTIEHDPPLDQETSLAAGGTLGRAYEAALDAIMRRLQAVGSKVSRAMHLPPDIADGEVSVVLPLPEPGMSLKWNADGSGLTNSLVDPDTGTADVDAIAALVQPTLEANLLDEITAAEAATDADRVAAAASAAAALVSENNAETAETNAETAQTAAVVAQLAAEAAAGANQTVAAQIVAAATTSTPNDSDKIGVVDVSASNALKGWTFTVIKAFLKTYFDGLYSALGHTHSFSSLTSKPTTISGYGITNAAAMPQAAGALYSYVLALRINGTDMDFGDTVGGSSLRATNSDDAAVSGPSLSGTWRLMGDIGGGGGDQNVSVFHRIA